MTHFWRSHSLSIVGLTGGTIIIAASAMLFASGKMWDFWSTLGAFMLGKGLEGPLHTWWTEKAKAEDEV